MPDLWRVWRVGDTCGGSVPPCKSHVRHIRSDRRRDSGVPVASRRRGRPMMVTSEGSSTLGHHAAPDALELGGAHGAAERPCPKAVGHAVHLERIGLRCARMNGRRHVGLADRATGRAAQVDLPIFSRRHAASIAVGEADIQSQMAPRHTMQAIVRTRPGVPGRPGGPLYCRHGAQVFGCAGLWVPRSLSAQVFECPGL
jgi:hypothetical protein